ncbi:iron chelate uptake ABC transporter family permease subunit [Streptomyces europaeiscabiei]|uniref:iron chelate uptake ABC transporter family permease subunit n=1 Tax=Streptomyces europaeiscabiei TaxID=146819 RepID=UPI0029B4F515|nr:iron chelate uptake ABC transporter family permease subunit [Streptomyces europaeiscabiei]MDX2527578.1 iron chelate uptake ABC transporter family permease subunit [Streptomyces europaeiscabiei]
MLVAVMVVAVSIGAVNIPVTDVWSVLVHHVTGQRATGDPALDQIVWTLRAPRVALAALVGAGLAVAGAVLQTLVSNPLADPIVLGFSYGGLARRRARHHPRRCRARRPGRSRRVGRDLRRRAGGRGPGLRPGSAAGPAARFELLDQIRATGITTLAVLHDLDLDLAARLCDHLVVLHDGEVVAAGPVLEVLTPDLLRDVFGVRGHTERHADGVVRITYAARPLARPSAQQP